MMGSTAATTLGMTSAGAAASAPGDAPASESGAGFVAALSAALPGAGSAAGASKVASTGAEGEEGGEPTAELAAAVAAMLQGEVAPAEELATAESDAAPDMASLPAASGARAWFAGLRPALAAEAGETKVEADSAESFLRQLTGSKPEVMGDALAPHRAEVALPSVKSQDSALPAKGDLRQLLQMMSQAAAAPSNVAPEIGPLAAAPGVAIAQAVEAAVSAANTVQPGASAPNSMLAAAASNFGSPLPQPPPATAAPPHTLHAEVGTPRWAQELGSRMTMMTLRGQHEGSLSLTPEHLGPVEVRISVSQNTAHVWFGAQHADARAALAEALPRLREMFGDAGMTLGHADVSQQAPRQGSREGALARVGGMQVDGADVLDTSNQPPARRVALGLVDTYV